MGLHAASLGWILTLRWLNAMSISFVLEDMLLRLGSVLFARSIQEPKMVEIEPVLAKVQAKVPRRGVA